MNTLSDGHYHCPLLVIMIYCIAMTRAQIFWVLRQPAVFGQDVQLFCNASGLKSCCITETRRWNGGPQQRIVTRNEVSSNKSKYVPIRETDGFSLLIKHFVVADVNILYTCSYGRQQYENVLRMDSRFTKYPMDIQTTSFKNTETKVYLEVKLKEVYPIPHCSVKINENLWNTSLSIHSTAVGVFYDITVVLNDSLTVHCYILVMDCTVGHKVFSVAHTITDNCKYNNETHNTDKEDIQEKIVLAVIGCSIMICVVVVAVSYKIYAKRKSCMKYAQRKYNSQNSKTEDGSDNSGSAFIKQRKNTEKPFIS